MGANIALVATVLRVYNTVQMGGLYMQGFTLGTGIAIAGAIVGFAQLWIAFIKLRMELLKPRLEVYEAYGKFLGLAMTHGTKRGDPEIAVVYDLYPKIGFLFGDDVRRLCEQILDAETKRRMSEHAIQNSSTRRDEYIDMNQKALETLNKCREAMEGTFKPYLNVSTIALPITRHFQSLKMWMATKMKKPPAG
ncbi:MAG TPA: hypothetical protein VJ019_10360 [Aestuariivirga sp.]|jgi:hypothetical protein|nr:hypothetical protein [Aestuariivirga sp.]